jgi:hypothetical protein
METVGMLTAFIQYGVEGKEHGGMQEVEIYEHARLLWDAHGPKAIALASQRASDLEKQGDKQKAANWRRIEAVLLVRRGPNQS